MIDEDLRQQWPERVPAAAARFLQGHLIERPPFFYSADLREPIWELTRTVSADTAEDERGVELLELEPDVGPSCGIITTQSCDVAEETRRRASRGLYSYPAPTLPPRSSLNQLSRNAVSPSRSGFEQRSSRWAVTTRNVWVCFGSGAATT